MAVRMADTAEPMGDFPIAKAKHIEFEDGEKLQEKLDNGTLGSGGGAPYDDTIVRGLIDTNKTDIADLNTKIGTTAMGTTATDVTGAVAEVNGNLLDTVSFSADYKNIVLNRKNGTNPYTIPISAIINHAKLIELADVDVTDIGNGKTLIYDAASQKHKYVDSTGTDELVKMDATADAHYLVDLIDKQTVVNENGTLKVKMLDGQDVTITEINFLKGLTMNVMDLVNTFANGGVKVLNTPVATYADLTTLDRSTFLEGISYIVYVLADETHAGAKTTYLCDKTSSTYFGNADSQRNFITDPIDLANEIKGKLPVKNIDVDSLWALLTVDDTYKTLTATDKVFGTHGAKAMYDELVTAIGDKANAVDLTTHTDDTDIHITTEERTKWDKNSTDLTTHTGDTDLHTSATEKASYVKKTNITTTIDSTSTDTQVPSAKAVFNSITSISSGSIQDNLTSLVLVTNLNDFKGSSFMIGRGTANSTANVPNGIDGAFVIEYLPYANGDRYGVQRITLIQSSENKYYTFERILSDNVWRNWKRVCTTSVADVPVTNIAPADTTTFIHFAGNPYCNYRVKNGVCYVNLDNVSITSSGELIRTGVYLPKSANYQGGTFLSGGGDATPHAYVFALRDTGELCFDVKDANTGLYGSFSYPVAE